MSESDAAGSYQAHARRAWIGARPMRIGAGQGVSESDGAGAQHTAKRERSRTQSDSDWAGAGPATKPGQPQGDSDVLGLPSGRKQLARTRFSVLPNGPGSDGFLMNHLATLSESLQVI